MKYAIPALASAVLFPVALLTACGGGGTSTPSSSATNTTPPASIGFKLPSTLVSSPTGKFSAKYSVKKQYAKEDSVGDFPTDAVSSYAYQDLKR